MHLCRFILLLTSNVLFTFCLQICLDHSVSISSGERPPPLHVCQACSDQIRGEHANANSFLQPCLLPLNEISLQCENKVSQKQNFINTRLEDNSYLLFCFKSKSTLKTASFISEITIKRNELSIQIIASEQLFYKKFKSVAAYKACDYRR